MAHLAQVQHSNRMAMVKVSRVLLAGLLEFPPETMIVQAFTDQGTLDVYLIVDHPDLPEVPEGARPPLASPTIKMEFDWGLEKKNGRSQ